MVLVMHQIQTKAYIFCYFIKTQHKYAINLWLCPDQVYDRPKNHWIAIYKKYKSASNLFLHTTLWKPWSRQLNVDWSVKFSKYFTSSYNFLGFIIRLLITFVLTNKWILLSKCISKFNSNFHWILHSTVGTQPFLTISKLFIYPGLMTSGMIGISANRTYCKITLQYKEIYINI